MPMEMHGFLSACSRLIFVDEQHASPGNGTRNGAATRSGSAKMRESAKEEESLDERIESVLSTLEGKVASPSPQWQLEWERRQANKTKSPASSRR